MKKLEISFNKKGFKYTQVVRKGNHAIYQQENVNVQKPSKYYEVVEIKSHNGYEIGGQKIAAAEVYPGSSQWGLLGWTYSDLKSAEKRFNKLVKGK